MRRKKCTGAWKYFTSRKKTIQFQVVARREAKMIIDEMKNDMSGMYEMQKRAMGLGGRRRRK